MTLYFKDGNGNRRFLNFCDTREDVFKEINKFLDEHNFKSYYSRTWRRDNEVWIDVGSHTEFFIVVDDENKWGDINDEQMD